MEIRHVFFHTFLARARSPDIYNRAQWSKVGAPLMGDTAVHSLSHDYIKLNF